MSKIMELFAEWERLDRDRDWSEEPEAEERAHACIDEMWEIGPKTAGELAAALWAQTYRCEFDIEMCHHKQAMRSFIDPELKSGIPETFEQWKAAMALFGKAETEEEASTFYEERCALLDRMVAEPSVTLRDFAMKLVAATGWGSDYENVWISKLFAEACDIAGVPASRDLLEALA